MAITCCKNCEPPERQPGCHSWCPRYLSEKKRHDIRLDKINRERQLEGDFILSKQRSISRNVKGRKR
jgi:hypothetical protein